MLRATASAFFMVGIFLPAAQGTLATPLRLNLIELGTDGRPLAQQENKTLELHRVAGPESRLVFDFAEVLGTSCAADGCASSARGFRFTVESVRIEERAVHCVALFRMRRAQTSAVLFVTETRHEPEESRITARLLWPDRPERRFVATDQAGAN